MKSYQAWFFGLLLLVFTATPVISGAPKEITLSISETGKDYALSVPVSKLLMTIPKGHLVQRVNTDGSLNDSPRYFYFQDMNAGLIVSGWFESSEDYSDFNKIWEEEKESWKSRKLPAPVNEKFFKAGGWQGVFYDIVVPTGANSHIKAHWVQAGTWIDLHISLTAKSSNSVLREQLLEFLKSIQVKQRS